jgi:hypothetical protein
MITNSCSCKTRRPFVSELGQSLRNLNRFSKGMTSLTFEQIGLFMDRTLNLAEATIFTPLPGRPLGVCDFPEQKPCCPEIACTLIREVFPGESVIEPILIRNFGKEQKEFGFETSPMKDFEMNEADKPVVLPDKVTLNPGESALVSIRYETNLFHQGRRYNADVKVKGYCEQTIHLIAHVTSPDAVRCTIAQKEHIKARRHDWRDHFYCEPHQAKTKDK